MKNLFFTILFLPTVMVAQKFQAKSVSGFNSDATMVVQSKTSQTNITGLVEAYLLMEGFNVRSEAISSSTKRYK